MDLVTILSNKFWSRDVWLPPNISWDDFKQEKSGGDQIYTDDISSLVFPLVLFLLGLQFIVERYWCARIGISLGIKVKKIRRAPYNQVLEPVYSSMLTQKQISGLASQLEWPERKVERWLRVRRSENKPTVLTKFSESGWRCLFSFYSFTFGLYALWDKPWLWDIKHCWIGFPLKQNLTSDIRWYYVSSMAFYIASSISQFFNVKRKDFWQMLLHHLVTVLLLSFSWVCNLYRVGSLVLVVHDCADIFMETAKMAKYCNYQKTCDALFATFTVVWILTRTGLYPFWIIYSTSVTAPAMLPMYPAYYIFNSLLISLLMIHILWTYYILRICYNSILVGQMDGDVRSCSSEVVSESSEEIQKNDKSGGQ